MKYKVSDYARLHKVQYRTIWNWIKKGQLQTERTSTNRLLIIENEAKLLSVAIYARVSRSENKSKLELQRLLDYCSAKGHKVDKIVTEIGSGLNDKRPKLESILLDNSINLIVIEHKDRLARFGLNYIQKR